MVLLVRAQLGPILSKVPLHPILPLPVVLIPPTLLSPLQLMVPLASLLLMVILYALPWLDLSPALLCMYCKADLHCRQFSRLCMSHMNCDCWCCCRHCLSYDVPRPVQPLLWQLELGYNCWTCCQDRWEDLQRLCPVRKWNRFPLDVSISWPVVPPKGQLCQEWAALPNWNG